MRFAVLLTALAALWVQPAQAVTIVLQKPTPEAGLHQKISLTGMTDADTITARGVIPAFTFYFWDTPTFLNGNEAITLVCDVASGGPACHEGFTSVSSAYPVKAKIYLDLSIVGNDIFIDWTMFGQDICASVRVEDRNGPYKVCGYGFYRNAPATLDFSVSGPSAQTFGYTVADNTPSPVPEPATWTLMILGIGASGAAMRRRRTVSRNMFVAV